MYDTIDIEPGILKIPKQLEKLPKDYFKSEEWLKDWQTKNLDSCMDIYVLTKKGLFQQHYKDIKKPKKEYQTELAEWKAEYTNNVKSFGKELTSIWKPKTTKRVPDRMVLVNYHGTIQIGNIKKVDKNIYTIDYELKFTDGKLIKSKCIYFKKTKIKENI